MKLKGVACGVNDTREAKDNGLDGVGVMPSIVEDKMVDSSCMCVICTWGCVLGVAGDEKTSTYVVLVNVV